MKLDLGNEKVVVSGTADQFGFGIEQDGLATIIDIVSNRIYSDKILAVIREYSCNASDANKEAGKAKTPIRITLPTALEPVFKVRDFGNGLSEDQVKDVFVQYGTSTKRNTNKFVGMFGIGSKSGFSYGNSFVVSSYLNGKRYDYSAFMDNKMPKMALLATDDTTEPNGLEIQIPVKIADIDSFVSKAKDFFLYWEVRPEFLGTQITFPTEEIVLQGKGWKICKNASIYAKRMIAVMGNVPYPVDANALGIVSNKVSQLSRYPITLNFKIGDLGVNAGREGLEYDDRTRQNIVEKLNEIINVFDDKVREQFKDCKTMYECKLRFDKVFDAYGPLSEMTQYFNRSDIKFDGVPVTDSRYRDFRFGLKDWTEKSFNVRLYQSSGYKNAAGYGRLYSDSTTQMTVNESILYVINDEGEITNNVANKLAPIIELPATHSLNALKKTYRNVYLITIEDAAKFQAWKDAVKFDAPTINLSSLPKVKLKGVYGVTTDNSEALLAQKTKVFTLDFSKRSHLSLKRQFFKPSEVDLKNGKGLYIVIDRYYAIVPEGVNMFNSELGLGRTLSPHRIVNWTNDFLSHVTRKGRQVRMPVVYAVRQRDVAEMGSGFKCFFKHMAPQTKKILDEKTVALYLERESALATFAASSNPVSNWFRKNRKHIAKHELVDIIAGLEAKLNVHVKDKIDSMVSLASRYGLSLPAGKADETLSKRITELSNQYPMIKGISYYDSVPVYEVLEYVKLVDESKKKNP